MLTKGKDLAKHMAESGQRLDPLMWDALVKLYVEAGRQGYCYQKEHLGKEPSLYSGLCVAFLRRYTHTPKRVVCKGVVKDCNLALCSQSHAIEGRVLTDYQFTLTAYSWALAYLISMTVDFVYIKHVVMTVGLSPPAVPLDHLQVITDHSSFPQLATTSTG
ncbi:hypothetical protein IFM89_027693 [Coptis chinensis]|uniref:Uncharacterized protein n=1 Tax=Coptis chinensis TaxID=261450 RepID=A0A835MJG6_9MAGN|nr:hypothetical protein IFM89_027693 [Coptis chinensis]